MIEKINKNEEFKNKLQKKVYKIKLKIQKKYL